MRRRLGLLGLGLLAACRASEPPTDEPSSEPAPIVVESEPPSPAVEPAPTIERSSEGRCEPTPREGQACDAARDSWCVLDWGEPGGHSSALWCRGGRWELEQEVNLD